MYLSYYGLSEKPFDISTDPKFLWLGEKHKEAFSVLKYGVLENKGFLLLTGDVGAGKTTLIHALVESIGDDVIHATIPDPGLELMEFYKYLAHAFKLDNSFSNKADFIFIFREFLHNAYDNGKQVLLIIDEAQRMSTDLLEEIRLLSNIELQNKKLLNIFFVGQVEFNTKLLEPENRAVRQRITISNHIQPLTEKETGDYIRHRLKVAGSQKNIFSYVAIHEIHKFSGGYPRLINIVCDIALLTGYVKEVRKIGEEIVSESIDSLNIEANTRQELEAVEKKTVKKKEVPAPVPVLKAQVQPAQIQVVTKSGWPRAATLYICLLLTIVVAYMLYSDNVVNMLKNVHGFKQSIPTVSEPKTKESSSGKNDKAGTQDDMEQRTVFPLGESRKIEAVSDNNDTNKSLPKEEIKRSGDSAVEEKIVPATSDMGSQTRENTTSDDSDFRFEGNRLVLEYKHNSNDFSDDGFQVLEKLARFMKMNPDVFVIVIGYTDDMGAYSYNVNLSSFRANIVKSYLVGKGIDISRIRATGLGPENPRSSNASPEGRKMNRRVEIEIMNKSPES